MPINSIINRIGGHNLRIGDKLRIMDTKERSRPIWRGRICNINKYYMTLKLRNYKECFQINDFKIGRYEVIE